MKLHFFVLSTLILAAPTAFAQPIGLPSQPLIVVEDKGGISAYAYYEELGLLAEPQNAETVPIKMPSAPATEFDMLPVRSDSLTPGTVTSRTIQAPMQSALFLIGTDKLSMQWLAHRRETLRELNAAGFVVNVETWEELEALRAIAPELLLSPVSGDDIAERLNLQHYPVLITPTSIEQ